MKGITRAAACIAALSAAFGSPLASANTASFNINDYEIVRDSNRHGGYSLDVYDDVTNDRIFNIQTSIFYSTQYDNNCRTPTCTQPIEYYDTIKIRFDADVANIIDVDWQKSWVKYIKGTGYVTQPLSLAGKNLVTQAGNNYYAFTTRDDYGAGPYRVFDIYEFHLEYNLKTPAVTPPVFPPPAVPEPTTVAMLLAGLGVVGAVARKRRDSAGRDASAS
ncbi:MAG: PEP-CTERM sorting domain-containing protein [Azoarcus sp.]|nr:PEP-CTERM sorting domain-containing protein [Azoarcus sp.]